MISFGISEIAVIPVRKEPDERSEMLTQIIFGETFKVFESNPKWSFIKNSFDDYEGWISTNSITNVSEDIYHQINTNSNYITLDVFNEIVNDKGVKSIIPFGSTIPNYIKETNSFNLSKGNYKLTNPLKQENVDILLLTKQFLNAPYLWGGKTIFGIDCSGFVQIIYKTLGNKLPRDSNQQVLHGLTINFISETEPGDLAFFDDSEGNIIHVGILINKNDIIHSSVKVRIDKIDQQGIFNEELKRYTHKLRIIKRIL